jgi:PDDEXK-like domain of unknown function (DUF3799)
MLHHPISFAEYRRIEAMSNSVMKEFDRSAAHAKHLMDNPIEPTPAMLKGSLTDHLLFGTEMAYAVSPYPDFKSGAAKDWKALQQEAGIHVFKSEVVDECKAMVYSIRNHPGAAEILRAGRSQVGMTWDLPPVKLKGLADWVSDELMCLTDLKTTPDASQDEFAKHLVNMGYDAQAALYSDLWRWNTGEEIAWVWIVAESEPPYATAVYQADEDVIKRGRRIYERRLLSYVQVLESGEWAGYPDAVQSIGLPAWAIRE